jgi:cyclomaltodextrinase
MNHWFRKAAATALLSLTASSCFAAPAQTPKVPQWPANSVIYSIYTSIFSPQGNFAGITAQLGRLKKLGVTDIWIMPITPVGQAINGHPTVDSPYDVHDYYAVNPQYGTPADLKNLINRAHKMGIRVLLDEVLNHTAWDNALITQHPEYYVHSDGNPMNPASIKMAFTYSDVAQLNYANPDLRAYMTTMLRYWITEYHVDGFRFDDTDEPDGPNRMIPADFWQTLGVQLRQTKPNLLMLGEEETPDLALKPFALDYGWHMYGTLKDASNGGNATEVQTTWEQQLNDFPADMRHMSILDDWDDTRDVNTFGGPAGALAAEAFYMTDTGVPLIYNGMEIGNAAEATNPHTAIDWSAGNPKFPPFYHAMIALREKNPALQQGAMDWLPNSVSSQVLTYTRSGAGKEFLVEVNLSASAAQGTVQAPNGADWKEVTPPVGLDVEAHPAPPQITLPAKGFAIFERSLGK